MRRSVRFFIFVIVGVFLVLTGLIVGLSSHYATFKTVGQSTIAHYLLGSDSVGYLEMAGNSNLYVVHQSDFTPSIAALQDGDTISLVYNPADTTSIDETSTIGTHLSGEAANVVAITTIDATSGQSKTYTTTAYKQNSQGTYQNNWTSGGVTLFIGLLMIGLAFVFPKRRAASFSVSGGIPFGPSPVNPYQQPLQGQPQPLIYQQQPYVGPYPPTPANQYSQPNQVPPYAQPEQAANPYAPYVPQPPTQYNGYPPPPPQQQSSGYEPTERANPYDPSNS